MPWIYSRLKERNEHIRKQNNISLKSKIWHLWVTAHLDGRAVHKKEITWLYKLGQLSSTEWYEVRYSSLAAVMLTSDHPTD